jgi:hypothetical protein
MIPERSQTFRTMLLEVNDLGAPSNAKDGAPAAVSDLAPFLSLEFGAKTAVLIAWAMFEAAECR